MVDLGKHVMDKTILDVKGQHSGKVDDLILDWPDSVDGHDRAEPEVTAILTGPLALTSQWWGWSWVARLIYRLLGVHAPHPVEVAWSRVAAIDVVVHLDVDREAAGLDEAGQSAARRYISRIPGA